MEKQEKLCRICLKNCGIDFRVIEENARKIFVFLVKSDLFIDEEAVMCGDCAESIKDCFNFKRMCLDVEDSVAELINRSAKLKGADKDDHEMCRLCRKSLNIRSFISLDNKLEDVELNQIMLNECLPELDLRVTEKHMICVPCRVSLQRYFGLLTNFSITEEKIRKYCEAARISATALIRLENVLEFTTKNTLSKIDSIKMEDEFCGDEYADEKKGRDDWYPSENTDIEEVDRIKIEEDLDCGNELQPDVLMKIEDQQSNDMPKFTIKCEKDNDHQVDVIETRQSYCQEDVNELELKQENLNSFQDGDISLQIDTDFNLPKMEECSLTHPQVLFVKSHCSFQTKGSRKVRSSSHKNISEMTAYQCEHCPFQAKYKVHIKRHLLTHKNPSEIPMYQCEHCSFQTKYKDHVKSHLIIHKNPSEITMYQCEQCSFQSKRKGDLKRHLLSHKSPSEITMYQCEHCSFQTKLKSTLREHVLSHKNPSEVITYQCKHCSFQSKYRGSLKNHSLSHKNPSEITMYPCEHCTFQTKRKWDLKKHLERHKNRQNVTTYQCERCPFQAKHKWDLKKHLERHKSRQKVTTYQCEHCPFQAKYNVYIKRHMLTHKNPSEIPMYQCEHCSYQTKLKGNLKNHLIIHKSPSDITMYPCEHCSFQSKRKGDLKIHLLSHKNPSEVTIYRCEHCSYQTKYRGSLINHLLIHKSFGSKKLSM